jgi:hypothetical protein
MGASEMTDPVFQEAYAAVRGAYSREAWSALTPRQITEAIYREIRRIDSGLSDAAAGLPPESAAAQS